jgi:hypothetical protein
MKRNGMRKCDGEYAYDVWNMEQENVSSIGWCQRK